MVLLFVAVGSVPALLYADVARIYCYSDSGVKIWILSLILSKCLLCSILPVSHFDMKKLVFISHLY